MQAMRGDLSVDGRTREICRLLLTHRSGHPLSAPVEALTAQAGVDLLPDWARRMHGRHTPMLARPLVHAGTLGVARTLRWAFT
ncbi:oxygenase MpaB family protein [Roseomonas sp. AR75]|uniref:oxygenase MpaB family protein n=1 Tax=Roseomonas sp. AR75 TaxID=2562311 RepID=UPI0010BFEAF5|nr:DUF2236 domain-containing protein [Roseomonas sp. AR75]